MREANGVRYGIINYQFNKRKLNINERNGVLSTKLTKNNKINNRQ